MKVSEAIKSIQMIQINLASDLDAEDFNALELSIEGLKRLTQTRAFIPLDPLKLLPGETPEDE